MSKPTRARRSTGGIPLQKSLGQHHLLPGLLCGPLIDFLRPSGHLVVEVGPGGGALTEQLDAAGARVVAIELDLAWGCWLRVHAGLPSTTVIVGDALALDWHRLPAGTLVTGNLPFNISTALIDRVLSLWPFVPRAAFLVQKEVADRLTASPGRKSYGALSVLTAARARVFRLGVVRRGSFRPPPKVDGAFIGLELRESPFRAAGMEAFADTVRLSFSQRRKQIRNALATGWGHKEAARALAAAGIPPTSRAEDVSLAQFIRLHRAHTEACDG